MGQVPQKGQGSRTDQGQVRTRTKPNQNNRTKFRTLVFFNWDLAREGWQLDKTLKTTCSPQPSYPRFLSASPPPALIAVNEFTTTPKETDRFTDHSIISRKAILLFLLHLVHCLHFLFDVYVLLLINNINIISTSLLLIRRLPLSLLFNVISEPPAVSLRCDTFTSSTQPIFNQLPTVPRGSYICSVAGILPEHFPRLAVDKFVRFSVCALINQSYLISINTCLDLHRKR
jgi:hypothetical protein